MKYNRGTIMKRAWEIRKASNPRITMSDALKTSWKQAKWNAYKEEAKMKGTEKQIAWALDIQRGIFEALDAKISDLTAKMEATSEKLANLTPEAEAKHPRRRNAFETRIAGNRRDIAQLEAGKMYFKRLFALPYFQDAHNVIEKRHHTLNADIAVTDALYMNPDKWEKAIANWAAL